MTMALASSLQLHALIASMHWLAAPLSKVVPAGHATWAQSMTFCALLAQVEATLTPQDCALLQYEVARALQAAVGLLVSDPDPPHATSRAAPKTSEHVNRGSTV